MINANGERCPQGWRYRSWGAPRPEPTFLSHFQLSLMLAAGVRQHIRRRALIVSCRLAEAGRHHGTGC